MHVHRRQFGIAFGLLAVALVALSFVGWFSRQVDGLGAVRVDVWHASTLWEWTVGAAVAGAVLAAAGVLITRAQVARAVLAVALGLEVAAIGLWLRQHWLLQFAPAYSADDHQFASQIIFVPAGRAPTLASAERAFPVAKNDLASYVNLPSEHAGETWASQAGLTVVIAVIGLVLACWYRSRRAGRITD